MTALGFDHAHRHAEAGGLAGAVAAQQADDFAAIDLKADLIHDEATAVTFHEVARFEQGSGVDHLTILSVFPACVDKVFIVLSPRSAFCPATRRGHKYSGNGLKLSRPLPKHAYAGGNSFNNGALWLPAGHPKFTDRDRERQFFRDRRDALGYLPQRRDPGRGGLWITLA